MALAFLTTDDRVEFGSDSSIDNCDSCTWIFWLLSTNLAAPSGARLMYKASAGIGVQIWIGGTGGTDTFQYDRKRATANSFILAPNGTFNEDEWTFLAIADSDGVAPQAWTGTLATPAVELPSYPTQNTGSGAADSDEAAPLQVGARAPSASGFSNCHVAYTWMYSSRLTEGQILAHQYDPSYKAPVSSLQIFCDFGHIGGGSPQTNYAGTGSSLNQGVNTGGTLVDHVPLPSPWAMKPKYLGGPAPGSTPPGASGNGQGMILGGTGVIPSSP